MAGQVLFFCMDLDEKNAKTLRLFLFILIDGAFGDWYNMSIKTWDICMINVHNARKQLREVELNGREAAVYRA